jgi:hypothetical protein
MASLGKAIFKGRSGKPYRFKVFPLSTRFRKISGIYVVATRAQVTDGKHRHTVIYVGHTEDFSLPLAKHRKAGDFAQQGANCICVQSDKSAESRLEKERDLIAAFSPKCND